MKALISYVQTNTLSIRGYLWRAFLIVLGLGIIATIIGTYWITSQKVITRGLQSDIVSQTIQAAGSLLTGDEQITLASGTLSAVPSQIDIIQTEGGYIGINTDSSCVDFFNTKQE
jgi:hypothetical protein